MDEHFCQYIVTWPETQDHPTIRCDAPATIKHTYEGIFGLKTMWVCATHYDLIQKNLADYHQLKKDTALKLSEDGNPLPKLRVHCGLVSRWEI